jgi:hypothetical protein
MRDIRWGARYAGLLATGLATVDARDLERATGLPVMLTSQRNDPTHFNVDPDFGVSTQPMTESDAARINAAQAKRDRKNAKRARDAMRGEG